MDTIGNRKYVNNWRISVIGGFQLGNVQISDDTFWVLKTPPSDTFFLVFKYSVKIGLTPPDPPSLEGVIWYLNAPLGVPNEFESIKEQGF